MVTGNPVNPFQPPAAGADIAHHSASTGSLEKAIAGDYDFEIGDVMSEAWELTDGIKATFWGGAIVAYVTMFAVLMLGTGIATAIAGSDGGILIGLVINIVTLMVTAPLLMGVLMLGIRRAAGAPVSIGMVFGYFGKLPTAAGAYLLTTLLTYVGILFLILPGIYLAFAYLMTLPLIAERDLPMWQAMETSRKALTHKWFRFFGLYFVVGLVVIVSMIPLGIGLIWSLPWSMLVMGVTYRRVFGTAEAAPGA